MPFPELPLTPMASPSAGGGILGLLLGIDTSELPWTAGTAFTVTTLMAAVGGTVGNTIGPGFGIGVGFGIFSSSPYLYFGRFNDLGFQFETNHRLRGSVVSCFGLQDIAHRRP